eukprot:TRINITY_DN7983_c0_g1_i1.p1 TRINITY_DN7983_c0_g1~~TRINITY_DN7983_c0_g1_i1.p1  ORF type:complete len:1032 (+),score=192.84 TRINITY_DN7983_c0_g1_i1:28-3096(+)
MASSFQELELLLNEYYGPISAGRRAQIETHLNSIRVEPQSWTYIQPIFNSSRNDKLQFFALSILECNFAGRWKLIPIEMRTQLRDFLSNFLVTNLSTLSHMILQRLVKCIVSIAVQDWPKRWPEFLSSVASLSQNPATAVLGAILLKETSQEFNAQRNDVRSKRKSKIKILLTKDASAIISQILAPAVMNGLSQMQSPATKDHGAQLAAASLEAMRQFYCWMPLNEILHPAQLDVLVTCVNRADKLSLLAFDCLNEIMTRNYVPAQHMSFIGQILSLVFQFLQQITAAGPAAGIDPAFINKFTEFTSLFVKNHMTRKLPFQLQDFLALMLKFTAFHEEEETFISCLDIWDDFVEFMQIQADTNLPCMPHEAEFAPDNYVAPLVNLADHLVDRIMFSTNSKILQTLETDSYEKHDENGDPVTSSELLDFQSRCFNIISGVLGLFPTQTIAQLGPKLVANLSKISAVQTAAASQQDVTGVVFDMCTSLRVFGSAMMNLVDKFAEHYDSANQIMQSLVGFAQHCSDSRVYMAAPLSKVHADAFQALRSSTAWLSAFLVQANDTARDLFPQFEATLTSVIQTTAPIFKETIPDTVAFDATRLLRSLCEQIHNPTVLQIIVRIAGSNDAFAMLHTMLDRYSLPVQEEIVTSICQSIVIPTYGMSQQQQDWASRGQQLAAVLGPISSPIASLSSAASPDVFQRQDAVAICHRASSIFGALLDAVKARGLGKPSLELLKHQIVPVFGSSLALLPHTSQHFGLLERLVSFHLEAMETFSSMMDASSLELVVQAYLSLLQTNNNLEVLFSGQDKPRVMLASALMRMLETIVKLPFSPLVGHLITYVIESIAPALKKSTAPVSLFEFYYQAVVTHESVILGNPAVSDAIYRDFLWALEQQDVETYRTVLVRLEDLGRRRNFFSTPAFTGNFFNPFIGTMFRVLLLRTHNLLWENMADVLWMIVKRTLPQFLQETLPALLHSQIFGHVTQTQQTTLLKVFDAPQDLMAFRRAIESVVDDYSYFMRTNNPTPSM